MSRRRLSKAHVAARYGVHPNTIPRWVRENPEFPRPSRLVENGFPGWWEDELDAFDAAMRARALETGSVAPAPRSTITERAAAPAPSSPLLLRSIHELGLTARARRCLEAEHIATIGQ